MRIPGSGRHEAILIPDSSIGTDQAQKFVFVVNSDGEVARTVVELGGMSHGLRIIRNGLKGDERIILRGLRRVRPGLRVKTSEEAVEVTEDSGLPDEYEPVPKEKWLSGEVVRSQPEAVRVDAESAVPPDPDRETAEAPTPDGTSTSTAVPEGQPASAADND